MRGCNPAAIPAGHSDKWVPFSGQEAGSSGIWGRPFSFADRCFSNSRWHEDSFSDPIRIENIQYSAYLVSPHEGITDLTNYYWKVQAIDEYGAIRESDTRHFVTNNTNPVAGWIKGLVYDKTTNEPINDAIVTIGSVNINSSLNGYYLVMVAPGNHSISINASGFIETNHNIVIPEGEIVTKNFSLLPLDTPISAIIQSPNTNITIQEGQSVNFQGAVSGGTPPYSFSWNFLII